MAEKCFVIIEVLCWCGGVSTCWWKNANWIIGECFNHRCIQLFVRKVMGLCLDAADQNFRVVFAFSWLTDADFAGKASPGHFEALGEQTIIRGSRRTMSFSFLLEKEWSRYDADYAQWATTFIHRAETCVSSSCTVFAVGVFFAVLSFLSKQACRVVELGLWNFFLDFFITCSNLFSVFQNFKFLVRVHHTRHQRVTVASVSRSC